VCEGSVYYKHIVLPLTVNWFTEMSRSVAFNAREALLNSSLLSISVCFHKLKLMGKVTCFIVKVRSGFESYIVVFPVNFGLKEWNLWVGLYRNCRYIAGSSMDNIMQPGKVLPFTSITSYHRSREIARRHDGNLLVCGNVLIVTC
jgi:hypothetical protein